MARQSPPLVHRMRGQAFTIFGEMSALATRLGAVNLGQGFPDEDGPVQIREAAVSAIREGRGNQYPPAHGVPELRQAIAEHQHRFYGLDVDWRTDVVVATGASEAIAATVLALVEPGDEVLMLDPYFDLYAAVTALAGATRVTVPLSGPQMRPDIGGLEAAITPKTRLLLLNSPHNPTGIVLTVGELAKIAELAVRHDLIVLADEAYEHLWFDPHPHIPIATLPGMWERTVTVGSGGKSFSLTGWKVGWATGPEDLIAAVRVVRQHLSYTSGGPFQWAMAEALALPDSYFDGFRAGLAAQRDFLGAGLTDLGFGVIEPAGTYFTITDVRPLRFADGDEFCRWAPQAAGVVAIPLSALSDHAEQSGPYVRWAFCKRHELLDEALRRLRAALA
ncbi:MAG: aminotransferase class I/II-fold pyridoxal phosphate-dependent enzyme [Candidatus Nanopelagicales bacterium]|nr:aminotransferase class I/II-fold pyridoxal phosphate-dependent enzyme [Candidatus Nanopelagicales bacterium]